MRQWEPELEMLGDICTKCEHRRQKKTKAFGVQATILSMLHDHTP